MAINFESLSGAEIALAVWLCLVAAMRLFSVFTGYFAPNILLGNVFGAAQLTDDDFKKLDDEEGRAKVKQVRDLLGRQFAIWTVVTCILCILCVVYLDNAAMVLATASSFLAAILFFSVEFLIYGTMTIRTIASPGIVATISLIWLLYRFSQLV